MSAIPLGAELNLALQVAALVMLIIGLRFAIRAHALSQKEDPLAEKEILRHKNVMTAAVLLSGAGLLIWMLPNLLMGWFYGTNALGYGTGGYTSYFEYSGIYFAHWYYLAAHVVLGSLSAVLGAYLVLRMRWKGFPEWLAVKNFRALMIVTWFVWVANILIGTLVFYYYAYVQTG